MGSNLTPLLYTGLKGANWLFGAPVPSECCHVGGATPPLHPRPGLNQLPHPWCSTTTWPVAVLIYFPRPSSSLHRHMPCHDMPLYCPPLLSVPRRGVPAALQAAAAVLLAMPATPLSWGMHCMVGGWTGGTCAHTRQAGTRAPHGARTAPSARGPQVETTTLGGPGRVVQAPEPSISLTLQYP